VLRPDVMSLRDLDPDHTKLKLIGHSAAGDEELSSTVDDHAFLLTELAQGLAEGGLSPDFEDFRLEGCETADAETRTAFSGHPELDKQTNTAELAPAQRLANAPADAGFARARVAGYEGFGVARPTGLHQERLLGTFEAPTAKARRSHVKRVFIPRKLTLPSSS